ncbi:MAG: exo-beta-N-acetylmuramidase NamZ domain-containing protein [Anaerolineae bacterium]
MSMLAGLDCLIAGGAAQLKGKRVGLATHPAAVTRDLTDSVAALRRSQVTLKALFGPEHGFFGTVADGQQVQDTVYRDTQLPIYSLYGTTQEPTPDMMADVDVLIFDIQDVGVRFYTFISTLFYVLKGAAKADVPVVVLDRPNPINGRMCEGPVLTPGFESFVGVLPIPLRYGLTIGELARYMNEAQGFHADLTVIPMEGWQRDVWFDETGLTWVPTSPAMPHVSTAAVYPGTCFLEGTNVSEGRGTALPFEVCGAPWIDGEILAAHLNALGLPGVRFRPTQFVPTTAKFAGEVCGGVQLHITDRETFRPVMLGLHLLAAFKALYPANFAWLPQSWEGAHPHIDLLAGTDRVRRAIDAGEDVNEIVEAWVDDVTDFEQMSHKYWLYT